MENILYNNGNLCSIGNIKLTFFDRTLNFDNIDPKELTFDKNVGKSFIIIGKENEGIINFYDVLFYDYNDGKLLNTANMLLSQGNVVVYGTCMDDKSFWLKTLIKNVKSHGINMDDSNLFFAVYTQNGLDILKNSVLAEGTYTMGARISISKKRGGKRYE